MQREYAPKHSRIEDCQKEKRVTAFICLTRGHLLPIIENTWTRFHVWNNNCGVTASLEHHCSGQIKHHHNHHHQPKWGESDEPTKWGKCGLTIVSSYRASKFQHPSAFPHRCRDYYLSMVAISATKHHRYGDVSMRKWSPILQQATWQATFSCCCCWCHLSTAKIEGTKKD